MGFWDVAKVAGTVAMNMHRANQSTGIQNGEIYRIWFENDPGNRSFIGQAVQGSLVRVSQHMNDANNPGAISCAPLLDEATRYFGAASLKYEVLERDISNPKDLDTVEKNYIKMYNSQYPNGYNAILDANGTINGRPPHQAFMDMINKTSKGGLFNSIGNFLSNPVVNDIMSASVAKSNMKSQTKDTIQRFLNNRK